MQLTPEEHKLLERYRTLNAKLSFRDQEWHELMNLWKTLCPILLRLFPKIEGGNDVQR